MNKYSIPDDKLDLFLFLSCEITKIKESIPFYIPIPGSDPVYKYKDNPESCAKITIIIDYIIKNITTNKTSIKRSIGSIYDLYTTWKTLCNKSEQYRKPYLTLLKNNFYLHNILKTFQTTKDTLHKKKNIEKIEEKPINIPDSSEKNYINQICEKYIENPSERKSIVQTLTILSEKKDSLNLDDIKLFLLEIGEKFPLYVLENIFNKIPKATIKTLCDELNLKPYWNSEKKVDHGYKLGKKHRGRPKRISIYDIIEKNKLIKRKKFETLYSLVDIISFGQKNKSDILDIDRLAKPFEEWIIEINSKEKLSLFDLYKYIFIIYGSILSKEIKPLLGVNEKILEVVLNTLNIPKYKDRTIVQDIKSDNELIQIIDEPNQVNINNSTIVDLLATSKREDVQISILPKSGDLQILIKYGTDEHKRCLSLINGKS